MSVISIHKTKNIKNLNSDVNLNSLYMHLPIVGLVITFEGSKNPGFSYHLI